MAAPLGVQMPEAIGTGFEFVTGGPGICPRQSVHMPCVMVSVPEEGLAARVSYPDIACPGRGCFIETRHFQH
jgi:hypothetical protein